MRAIRRSNALSHSSVAFGHSGRRPPAARDPAASRPAEGAVVERPKGAAQLAKIVGAIARREWVGPGGEFGKAVKIYPVLVVYDERLGIPGCGKFLDDEFKSLLQPMPQGIAVAPLTIMSIGDLENLETSTVNFAMRDLLKDYTRECPDRMRSLHQFMATSSYAARLKPSQRVRDASEELMHRIQRNLFPQGLTVSLAGPDE